MHVFPWILFFLQNPHNFAGKKKGIFGIKRTFCIHCVAPNICMDPVQSVIRQNGKIACDIVRRNINKKRKYEAILTKQILYPFHEQWASRRCSCLKKASVKTEIISLKL